MNSELNTTVSEETTPGPVLEFVGNLEEVTMGFPGFTTDGQDISLF
jgi:hypothetical protein